MQQPERETDRDVERAEPQYAYAPVSPWRPVSALLAAVGVVALSVLVPLLVLRPLMGGGTAADAIASVAGIFTVLIASQVVMGGGGWFLAGWFGGVRREVLALKPPRGGLKMYFIAIVAMVAVTTAYNLVRHYLLGHDIFADLRVMAPLFRNPMWPLSFAIIAIGAPLAEEVLFRGFLQSAFPKGPRGFILGAALSTLIWTLLHSYSIPGMILVATLGVLFSWMLWWSGSLRVPIAAHAFNNAVASLYVQFGPPL